MSTYSGNGGAKAVVQVRGLRRRFGDFWAVSGVDLQVGAGEVVGLLGPNGAGKSTIIRMICGLLLPTAGEISVAGIDPVRRSLAVKARIGYMTQQFSLYPDLTVTENLSFYGAMYGIRGPELAPAVARWSTMLGLEQYAGRPTGDLPPGWAQRLAFACAVIAQPPVLLLDEPTSGVDLETSDLAWNLCALQAGRGAAVLVTTHSMAEAERCQRVCIVAAGRVVGQGAPQALADTLRGRILRIQAEPLGAGLAALKAWPRAHAVAAVGSRLRVEVTGDPGTAETQARQVIEQAGAHVDAIEIAPPTLDDVFVHLATAEKAET